MKTRRTTQSSLLAGSCELQKRITPRRYGRRWVWCFGWRNSDTTYWATNFVFHVDHYALQHLVKKANLSWRIARWMLLLQEFTFTVQTRKGIYHENADYLSRLWTQWGDKIGRWFLGWATLPDDGESELTVRGSLPLFAYSTMSQRNIRKTTYRLHSQGRALPNPTRGTIQTAPGWAIVSLLGGHKSGTNTCIDTYLRCRCTLHHQEHNVKDFECRILVAYDVQRCTWLHSTMW